MPGELKRAPGFMTYREAALIFALMPDDEAAQAIKATVNYFLYGRVTELHGVAKDVFEIMQADIDSNQKKYEKRCETNKRNRNKGRGMG